MPISKSDSFINISNSIEDDKNTIINMYRCIYLILENKNTYEKCLELLSRTNLVVLEDVSNLETAYFMDSKITNEIYKKDINKLITIISITKTFFYNDREKFEELFLLKLRALSTISFNGIESNVKTMQYLMKYIPMEYNKFIKLLKSSDLLPYQLQDMANIYMLSQRLSIDTNLYERFKRVVRSKDFIGLYIFSSSMINDENNDLGNLLSLAINCSNIIDRVTLDLDDYRKEELESLREQYKAKVKEIAQNYKPKKEEIDDEEEELIVQEEPIDIPSKIKISSFDKIELMKNNKFLLFKSKDIKLTNYWGNITVRDVDEINKNLDFTKYDGVLLLTKKIKHSDYYKLRSVCDNKIMFISSTNRNSMIDEIFDKF